MALDPVSPVRILTTSSRLETNADQLCGRDDAVSPGAEESASLAAVEAVAVAVWLLPFTLSSR